MSEEEYIERTKEKINSRRKELANLRRKDPIKYCDEIDKLEQLIEHLEDQLANI